MFTLGFRIFGLFSLVAVVGAIVYGISTGDTSGKDYFGIIDTRTIKGVLSFGWQGGVGEHLGYVILAFLAFVSLGMGVVLVMFRDASAVAVAELENQEVAPKATTTPHKNFWPLVVVAGFAVVIVGLAISSAVVIMGFILTAIAVFEWAIFNWSERLTADPMVNRQIRNKVMAPIEIPVIGIAVVAILAIGVSRILLSVSEVNAVWVGTGIAIVVFLGAVVLATKPKISQGIITSILVVGALGIIVAGIVYASIGGRAVHHEKPLKLIEATEIDTNKYEET